MAKEYEYPTIINSKNYHELIKSIKVATEKLLVTADGEERKFMLNLYNKVQKELVRLM